MANDLILKSNEKPGYLNKEMVVGLMLAPLLLGGGILAVALGAAVGGFIGKKRIEREAERGKVVSQHHTVFNKDTLIGGLLGMSIGQIVGGMAVIASGPLALGIAGLAMATGAVVGSFLGNKAAERNHAVEYEMAKQQTVARSMSADLSPESSVEYSTGHSKSWAKEVAQQRMNEQSQQR